jgi:hypothetical protein
MNLSTPHQPDLTDMAGACLEQMAEEEKALGALIQAGRELQQALLGRDARTLREAQQKTDELAHSLTSLREQRASLRQRLGESLGCGAELATVRLLAGRVGGAVGEQLSAARQRARTLAETVDALTRRNAALASYCLGFVQRCLAEITGAGRAGSRYGPSGTQVEASRGCLLQARG